MSYLLDNRKREMGSPKTFFFASFPACELLYTKGWPRKTALIRVFTAKESENNGRSSLSQHKKIGSSVISMVPNWKKHLYFVTKVSFTKLNAAFSSRKRGV